MSKLAQAFKKGEGSYLVPCPKCGILIPPNIKGCWNCGKILDPHLTELVERDEK